MNCRHDILELSFIIRLELSVNQICLEVKGAGDWNVFPTIKLIKLGMKLKRQTA